MIQPVFDTLGDIEVKFATPFYSFHCLLTDYFSSFILEISEDVSLHTWSLCICTCSRSENRDVSGNTDPHQPESGFVDLLYNFSHVNLKPAVSQCTNDNKHMCNACVSLLVRRTHLFISLRPSPIAFPPPKQISLPFLSSVFLISWCSLEAFNN